MFLLLLLEAIQQFFYSLEGQGLLDPLNDVHLYALHFIYLPRINQSLRIFKEGWNCHKLQTVGKSLQQLFTSSRITQVLQADNIDEEHYGVDEDGPIPCSVDLDTIEVPSIQVQLQQELVDQLSAIDPTQSSDNHGIDLYVQVCNILKNC